VGVEFGGDPGPGVLAGAPVRISVITVPHGAQRYDTAGDWQFGADGDLRITVSELGDWRWETLVALHEIVEAVLCRERGISQETVDLFDRDFTGPGPEPGLSPVSPYRREHLSAEIIERTVASALGVDWLAYEDAITAL
jgi:hypothetical protein